MSDKTAIEWTDATWNPVRGCSRVSRGCENCYAERVAARFSQDEGDPFFDFAEFNSVGEPRWTGNVELVPWKLDEPLRWRRPRRIFVNSMSDLFHEKLSFEDIRKVFATMLISDCTGRGHVFQILTKRPERMLEFSRWYQRILAEESGGAWSWPLSSVWLGVSVEDQATADERIPMLLQTPAAVRFISAEPLLGPVDFSDMFGRYREIGDQVLPCPDWVIVGGESGPGARPCAAKWIIEIVGECRRAGVSVFVKQLGARPTLADGSPMDLRNRSGKDMAEWPAGFRVREFPEARA